MRSRTVMAIVALLALNLLAHHIRAINADGDWSAGQALVTVNGAPYSIEIAIPASVRDHVSGVAVNVEEPTDGVVTVEGTSGAIPITVNALPSPDSASVGDTAAHFSAVVIADSLVTAQVTAVDAAGDTTTVRGSSLNAITLDLRSR